MKLNSIISSITIIFIILSCAGKESSNPQNDIIGKWQTNDKSLTLDFTNQGKVNSINKQGSFSNEMTADLIFIDDVHIVGVWEFNLATWKVNIYGDKMTLIRDDGEKLKLNKI